MTRHRTDSGFEFEVIKVPIEELDFGLTGYNRSETREVYIKRHREFIFYQKVFESIKYNGLVNPLIVLPKGRMKSGNYRIVYGNNRAIALIELGYTEIPSVVVPEGVSPAKFKELIYRKTNADVL